MPTHRRLAPIHVLAFARKHPAPRRAEWPLAELPGRPIRLNSEVVPFVPPEDPPPPAMAQPWAA
jgi:hypothetical protein